MSDPVSPRLKTTHHVLQFLALLLVASSLSHVALVPRAAVAGRFPGSLRATSDDGCPAPARDYWKPDGRAGDLEFDIPNHWKRVEDQGFVMLTPVKAQQGQTTRIGLLDPQTLTNDVRQFYAGVWNQWRRQFNMLDNGQPEIKRSPHGFETLSGYSRIYSQSLGNGTFHLVVARKANRAQPYFYLDNTGDVDYDLAFETFQNSVQFANTEKSALPQPGVPCGLEGVYMGFRVGEGNINGSLNSAMLKSGILVFFPDGNVLRHMPEKGLQNFDFGVEIKQSRDDCGRYRMIGNQFKITWSDNTTVTGERDGKDLKLNGFPFTPAINTDGLKLNGTFRADRAPTDARIRFTSDGDFVENGILEAIDFSGQNKSPGRGTYNIERNTLELRYQSGRNVHLSFYILAGDLNGSRAKLLHLNSHAFVPAQ